MEPSENALDYVGDAAVAREPDVIAGGYKRRCAEK